MNTPLEADLEISDSTEIYSDHVEHLRSKLKDLHQVSRANQSRAKQSHKKQYDKRAKVREYTVGQYVYLHTPQVGRHRVKKLAKLWQGPYQIIQVINDLNVRLKVRKRECVVHVNRIKPCMHKRQTQGKEVAVEEAGSHPDSVIVYDGPLDGTDMECQEVRQDTLNQTGRPSAVNKGENSVRNTEQLAGTSGAVVYDTITPSSSRVGRKCMVRSTGDRRVTRGESNKIKAKPDRDRVKTIKLRSGKTVNYR